MVPRLAGSFGFYILLRGPYCVVLGNPGTLSIHNGLCIFVEHDMMTENKGLKGSILWQQVHWDGSSLLRNLNLSGDVATCFYLLLLYC